MARRLALFLLCALWITNTDAVVTLEDNGYTGLVIAIHKDVEDEPLLVDYLRSLITTASMHLYRASRNRAFFRDVTIVVPSTWQPRQEYEVVQGGDRFSRAEVRVDNTGPDPEKGSSPLPEDGYLSDTPYTLQPGECGEPGQFIHVSPGFLKSIRNSQSPQFGDPGKVFVHEWAHFRYGVFDEHGFPGDEKTPNFYKDTEGRIHSTGCVADIRGWLMETGGNPCVLKLDGTPSEECVFYPDENSTRSSASVMYLPSLPSVEGFCDDTPENKHNPIAPNLQNLRCQGRSTWEIVSKHPDFVNDRNPPTPNLEVTPRFRVIQPKKNQRPTFVLVLDVSASMRGKRIDLLRAAVSRFIKYQLADFSTVGMVAFSTNSSVLSNMTMLDESKREMLLDKVPKRDDDGFTAIGKGILSALKLLEDSNEPTEGTLLLLVSDGEENVDPYISNILDKIRESRVIINTIAFGQMASTKLESLVKLTGGRGFFYDDENVSHKVLDSAFIESAATHADLDLQPVEIANKEMSLNENEISTGEFRIDPDVGTNTVIHLTYDYPGDRSVSLTLWSPDGRRLYEPGSAEYHIDSATLSVTIKLAQAEPGRWRYRIENKVDTIQDVTLVVSSEARDIKEQPVRVRSWVSDVEFDYPAKVKVYAEVKKGYHPVVSAAVMATVTGPGQSPQVLALYDNGAGADTIENDGIYSGYFTNFNGTGRYSVDATVINDGRAKIKLINPASRAPRHPKLPEGFEVKEAPQASFQPENYEYAIGEVRTAPAESLEAVDDFERFTAAGSFRLQTWSKEDLIPPSRVIDLKVTETNLPERTVTLQWTSSGDDLDKGTADKLELRYHRDPLVLLKNFLDSEQVWDNDLEDGDLVPIAGNEIHTVIVKLPEQVNLNSSADRQIFFAVQYMDKNKNVGDVSNIAEAFLREPVEMTPMNTERLRLALLVLIVTAAAIGLLVALTFTVLRVRSMSRSQRYHCQYQSGKQLA